MKRTGKMPLGFRLPRQPLECCRVGDSPGILSKGEAARQPAELCGDAHLVQAEFCLRLFGESSNLLLASSVSQQSGIFQIIASCVQSRAGKPSEWPRPPGGQSRDTGCLYPLKIINSFSLSHQYLFHIFPKRLFFFHVSILETEAVRNVCAEVEGKQESPAAFAMREGRRHSALCSFKREQIRSQDAQIFTKRTSGGGGGQQQKVSRN